MRDLEDVFEANQLTEVPAFVAVRHHTVPVPASVALNSGSRIFLWVPHLAVIRTITISRSSTFASSSSCGIALASTSNPRHRVISHQLSIFDRQIIPFNTDTNTDGAKVRWSKVWMIATVAVVAFGIRKARALRARGQCMQYRTGNRPYLSEPFDLLQPSKRAERYGTVDVHRTIIR